MAKVGTCEAWVLSIVFSNGDTPWEDLFVQVEGEDGKIIHGETTPGKCGFKGSPTYTFEACKTSCNKNLVQSYQLEIGNRRGT